MHVELTTRRLRLRPLGSGDQDAVHAYASDPANRPLSAAPAPQKPRGDRGPS